MSFRVKKYLIKTNKFKHTDKISMIFLSDLHLTEHGRLNHDLKAAITNLKPDVILAGGDMITGKEEHATTIAEDLLLKLAEDFQVYCSLGNHEQRVKEKIERFGDTYKQYISRLSSAGVIMLDNESLTLDIKHEKLRLHGLNLPLLHYHRFTRHELPIEEISKRLGLVDTSCFNLLLAHHPRFAETYFKWGADLTLSGHVHGGVMRLGKKAVISPDFQIFPKYGYGEYIQGNQCLLISGGLGEHTVPFRLFNPKELLYIEIVQEVSHGDSR